jgi:hypothetical protein
MKPLKQNFVEPVMNLEMIARTMQFIIAPAVMINACAVLLTGLLAHAAAINARLRDMNRERIEHLRYVHHDSADALTLERLGEIDTQLPELLYRHRLVRDALLYVYSGVACFVASMLVIAVATALASLVVALVALVVFMLGTGLALMGLLVVSLEIRRSHLAVEFEASRVVRIGMSQTPPAWFQSPQAQAPEAQSP